MSIALRETDLSTGGRRRGRGYTVALVALGAGLLLVASLLGYSSAHTRSRATSLSIHKIPSGVTDPGDKVLIVGKLKPNLCKDGQTIKLKQVQPGRDSVLGKDKTDGDGEYRIRIRPKHDMKVYTKFAGSVDTSYSYGHSHTCEKSKSARVRVRVTG